MWPFPAIKRGVYARIVEVVYKRLKCDDYLTAFVSMALGVFVAGWPWRGHSENHLPAILIQAADLESDVFFATASSNILG